MTGLRVETSGDGVATVVLDRPDRLNAIDLETARLLTETWRRFRYEDTVRAVVLTGAGTKAFCTGIDRAVDVPQPVSPFSLDDPLLTIGPKANDLWKPVVAAVEGMACGGAFYLLGECEFVVASRTATFFDPHTTYGMVSAYETAYLAQCLPYGEAARLALMGTAERLTAERAYAIGLVSELTAPGAAPTAARACATVLASYPPTAVEGTVRALWSTRSAALTGAHALAPHLIALGNLPPTDQTALFTSRPRTPRPR